MNPTCKIHKIEMKENGYERGYRVWKCPLCYEKVKLQGSSKAHSKTFLISLILIYTLLLTSFGGFL